MSHLSLPPSLPTLPTPNPSALAWGPIGHEVVAGIAQSLLNSNAQQLVKLLLNDDDMA